MLDLLLEIQEDVLDNLEALEEAKAEAVYKSANYFNICDKINEAKDYFIYLDDKIDLLLV